jgi:hypothetical protein
MPAQRRRFKKDKRKRNLGIIKLLIIALLAIALFFILFLNTEFWNGDDKLSLVINTHGGDVVVATFDPELEEVTKIVIPADTEVQVSRQLGTWRLKSVWQLGENEGWSGQLLAETVTKHFKLPVIAWADEGAIGFSEGSLASVLKAVALPYKTNLKIGDRIHIALFSLGVINTKRVDINLAETPYLKRRKLVDGEEGYLLVGKLPEKLLVIFSDPKISEKNARVVIRDASGKPGLAQEIGEIIEVLGAKVVSITKEKEMKVGCEIYGREEKSIEKIGLLFSCNRLKEESEGEFDLEIRIGKEFAKRF